MRYALIAAAVLALGGCETVGGDAYQANPGQMFYYQQAAQSLQQAVNPYPQEHRTVCNPNLEGGMTCSETGY